MGYLLSDAAAEARRRYVFTIHPMTNVDGVADGYEYRGGYDYTILSVAHSGATAIVDTGTGNLSGGPSPKIAP